MLCTQLTDLNLWEHGNFCLIFNNHKGTEEKGEEKYKSADSRLYTIWPHKKIKVK